jgi:flagellar protein FliS
MMNRYLEQQILTAEPVELTRLVYQAAIAAVRDARTHLREGRIAERTRAFSLAYSAITELDGSLNPEAAPELSNRLRALYLYMEKRLVEANTQQSDAPFAEVLSLLITLSEAWNTVAQTQRAAAQGDLSGMQPASGSSESARSYRQNSGVSA